MVAGVARVPGAAGRPAELRRFAGQRGRAKTHSVAALAAPQPSMKSTTTPLLRAADRARLDLEPGAPWLAAVDFDRAGDPHLADPAAAGAGTTTGPSPNSSVATSSAANTKAGPCARTSACPAPKTGFSRSGASRPEYRLGRLNYLCLPVRAESHLISIPLGSDICAVRAGWRADLARLRVG
jgi:hypothetical protein